MMPLLPMIFTEVLLFVAEMADSPCQRRTIRENNRVIRLGSVRQYRVDAYTLKSVVHMVLKLLLLRC